MKARLVVFYCMLLQAWTASGMQTGPVIYNLDSSEFFVGTFGPVTPETIKQFADRHARLGVTDLFVNVNHKRTNYDSKVWDAGWTGLDPDSIDIEWIRNVGVFHRQGYDYPKLMLDRAREAGMTAWISIRMNDAHVPEDPNHPLHSAFWKAHPEWHLENGGLDFERPEVRSLYLDLLAEVCARYDSDGIELDFLRFPLYFRPGREAAGLALMTDLVRDVREMTNEASRRLGHPVYVGVRVPTSPEIALRHGLDAVDWAKEGLVDLMIATPWWTSANSDIPVEEWRRALDGTGVEIAVSIEEGIDSGALPRRTMTDAEMRGIFASAWDRGTNAVYFFNLFTNPIQMWPDGAYDGIIRDAADLDALAAGPRRHVVTIADPWSPTEPRARRMLPATGDRVELDIHVGPAPDPNQPVHVELVVADTARVPTVSLNDVLLDEPERLLALHLTEVAKVPQEEPIRLSYAVPPGVTRRGYNHLEIRGSADQVIEWAEIFIDEER